MYGSSAWKNDEREADGDRKDESKLDKIDHSGWRQHGQNVT